MHSRCVVDVAAAPRHAGTASACSRFSAPMSSVTTSRVDTTASTRPCRTSFRSGCLSTCRLPGTLGAVIRIRQPIASKRQFFDIGIAGPIAGFLVLVPVLVIGVSLSGVVTLPSDFNGSEFGEPLLFRLVSRLIHGTPQPGQAINYHPVAWAAWFGLLATALNLCPVSQLDGGHISYAVFGRYLVDDHARRHGAR